MRAIIIERFGGPEVLALVDVTEPKPGPGEVSVRVALTGVNFADVMVRRGGYGRDGVPPLTPGLDCVGTVIDIGEGVTSVRVGQRVAAFADRGTYAEVVLARETLVYPVPDAVSDESAATLTMLVTAYNLLTLSARLSFGESVLVHAGAGGVGSIAIQLARRLGAGQIIATVGSATKLTFARNQGADVVINYLEQELGASVQSATSGKGVDIILDSVVGDLVESGFDVLAPFGRYIVYGASSGMPATVSSAALHRTSRSVIGYSTASYRKFRPDALRPSVNAIFSHVAQGDVTVPIGGRFPLAKVSEAHAFIESRQSMGKILITMD